MYNVNEMCSIIYEITYSEFNVNQKSLIYSLPWLFFRIFIRALDNDFNNNSLQPTLLS